MKLNDQLYSAVAGFTFIRNLLERDVVLGHSIDIGSNSESYVWLSITHLKEEIEESCEKI